MKKPREELQEKLEELIGNRNVYFQQPEGFKIKYPCIIYKLSYMGKLVASNTMYKDDNQYSVTIIDKDPDSELPDKLLKWDYCSFNRFFTSDNLNHWVFELYW